jgi:hypothetical protein
MDLKLLIPLMKLITPSFDLAGMTLGLDLSGWIYCTGTRSNSIFEVTEDAIYDTFLDELLASLERLMNYCNPNPNPNPKRQRNRLRIFFFFFQKELFELLAAGAFECGEMLDWLLPFEPWIDPESGLERIF